MSFLDHGIPVTSARLWTAALSPDAAGTGWNYISVSAATGGPSLESIVVKDFTGGAPTQAAYFTPSHHYPNSNFTYAASNQLRALNGRIFFPLLDLYTNYYDPTDEQVHQIGPVTETPPQASTVATQFYSATFDVAGLLYFATQESQYRQSCVVVTDTTTTPPTQTIIGYIGSGALSYSTYGYRIAADTTTSAKYVYVVYGETPWQLWALNTTTGVATKLIEVTSVGNIQFSNIAGKGWTAIVDTDLGKPDNVRTQYWCLDGALYAYTAGQNPPSGAPAIRNVTPASNPLVSPPQIDTTLGVGVLAWRSGTSGPYTIQNYNVTYKSPVTIESLVASNQGIVGNAQQYLGFFQYFEPADTRIWNGSWSTGVSQPTTKLQDGAIYIAGYPNGVFYKYLPDSAWQINVNPSYLGAFGLQGIQFAGIKYVSGLTFAPLAGAAGRWFCCGTRERNGNGSGIGSYDITTHLFDGTYSKPGMDSVLPTGMCAIGSLGYVVMATKLITPPGTADLFVFDYAFNLVATLPVISGLSNLGNIVETATPGIIAGVVQGSGNSLGVWQYNLNTQTFVQYVELPIIGALSTGTARGSSVWLMSGTNIVRLDVSSITASVIADASSIGTVTQMGFAADGQTLFLAAGNNTDLSGNPINGAQLFSFSTGTALIAGALSGAGAISDASMIAAGAAIMSAGAFSGAGHIAPATLHRDVIIDPQTGSNVITLFNDESTNIAFGQPLYCDGGNAVRLADAANDGRGVVIGIVADASIVSQDFGQVALEGYVVGTAAQWDAACGTVGGLTFGTIYYLHPTISGRLTSVPPSSPGQQSVRVLRALSSTEATLCISPPVLL